MFFSPVSYINCMHLICYYFPFFIVYISCFSLSTKYFYIFFVFWGFSCKYKVSGIEFVSVVVFENSSLDGSIRKTFV